MSEEKEGLKKYQAREPRVALTVDLSEKARVSPDEVRRVLLDAVGSIPDAKLRNLRSGVVTVIA